MLINLTSPRCPVPQVHPCSCYTGTCCTKIQSEIIIQIKTLLRASFKELITSVEKAEEICSRRRNKTLSHKLTIRLLFLIFTTRKLTVETFWDVKNSAWGKYLLKLLSIRFTFKSNFKLSCFLVESSCFAVNLFVLRGEIASGNVSKRWSKISPWIWTPFPIQDRTLGCY